MLLCVWLGITSVVAGICWGGIFGACQWLRALQEAEKLFMSSVGKENVCRGGKTRSEMLMELVLFKTKGFCYLMNRLFHTQERWWPSQNLSQPS